MMISPECYVELNLKGKSREQVYEEIENLRNEIKSLKKEIENHDQKEFMIHPTPEVQYSVYMDYLAAAKKYVKSQGWEFIPPE